MSEKEEFTEEVEELKDLETEAEEKAEAVSEIEKLTTERDQFEDQFLRARAEIANITNRNRNEREQLQKYRSQDLAKKLLSSIDNLERALQTEVQDEQGASLKKGVEMVLEGLLAALKEEGVEEIPAAKGDAYDPNVHHGVQIVPATEDLPADTIVEVFQKGYRLHDRVLRPSMVIVAQ
ncbi:nucleotide exchange factor GrpE [Enterococcus asini]|uniref:Protein GrpE n=1 Tax=Enterococcus asini ATCC 700915 TaxID=1158606 RepID=R2SIQ6_9ENTE|nr:nucleotide exchange factor GrpE [Enterococcus asini]EOH88064.1 co-chaperone GrpE [Enterococcus asini ATCC 700915]EOT55861.1 co-chaperone GrpE [Enterococcus asini ATCC 700915]MCD5029193.1 nucleotide exchange factor GrpE [Enterococcus asini]MDT2744757.1 nucleotide exchange factor GrpE [Enterococcus asini]MDT2764198.1 nucleotide exchange factor GrpE [Enterococcus asini]